MRAYITSSLVVALLSFSFHAHSQTATVAEVVRAGTFKQVQGEAWVGSATERRPATPGEGVRVSQRISTGKTGAATLTLKDGTVLTVGPNSTMDLSAFEFNATTQEGNFLLDLLQGTVRVVTGLVGKTNPEKFKVKTPTSVVGVRGTDFIVETESVN